jgi:primary-amine oxidase
MLSIFTLVHALRFWTGLSAAAMGVCMAALAVPAEEPATRHPLDPFSKEEITTAVDVLKASGKVSDSSHFPIIVLHEPPKDEVLRFTLGGAMRREAFAVIYERASNATFEAVVDLNNRRVISWQATPGVQPAVMFEEFGLVPDIVRADTQWQEARRKRGITDFDQVQIDPWSAGSYGFADEGGVRVVRALSYDRGSAKNAYPPHRGRDGLCQFEHKTGVQTGGCRRCAGSASHGRL